MLESFLPQLFSGKGSNASHCLDSSLAAMQKHILGTSRKCQPGFHLFCSLP